MVSDHVSFWRGYSLCRDDKKSFLALRVPPDVKGDSGNREQGSEEPFAGCELPLSEGVQAYKKEGPNFLELLVVKAEGRSDRLIRWGGTRGFLR